MAKLTGTRLKNWRRVAQDADARAREHEMMYDAERKTVAELRDKLQTALAERDSSVSARSELARNLERRFEEAKLHKERHEAMLSHVKIAMRACQRAKGRKKKGPSLRQAQAILEAAVEEDGHYASKMLLQVVPLWAAFGASALAYAAMFLRRAKT